MDPQQIIKSLAGNAGLTPLGRIEVREGNLSSLPPASIDPCFDSLGEWNYGTRTITLDDARCRQAADHFMVPYASLRTAVLVHFCARVVVQLGIHPETGNAYLHWDDATKMFAREPYSLRPNGHFYDSLVREHLLFAQIFSRLHLKAQNDPNTLKAFELLSKGHYGLYDLNYRDWSDHRFVPSEIQVNWADAIDHDFDFNAERAKSIFIALTRIDLGNGKGDVLAELYKNSEA